MIKEPRAWTPHPLGQEGAFWTPFRMSSFPVNRFVFSIFLRNASTGFLYGDGTCNFCGPLYHDPERVFWEALGNEPIFSLGTLGQALLRPLKLRRELQEMGARQAAKGVAGNMNGDGLAKGGILVIAPDDQVCHVFKEDPGKGVPSEEMAALLSAARRVAEAADATLGAVAR